MQVSKTKPKNTAFFNRYAELITSLTSVASIAQFITGACEIGILYSLLYPSFADVVPIYFLNLVSITGAIICAAMLQIGLKKVFPYSIRAILHGHFNGLDLAVSIFIFILTASLLTASVYLSFNGSKEIAEFTVPKPIEKTTTKSDSVKLSDFATAQKIFTSDSATIETKFKGKSEATESEFMNRIKSIERTGKQATTLRAELKTKLATLQSDKATELETKATERKKYLDHATDRADHENTLIETDNTTAKRDADLKKAKYKGYIGYFTLVCYIFFLSVFAINEIYHKGADIKTKPIPSQRHFNASILSEFSETVKEKLDVYFRTKILAWADKTEAQPLPNALRALYDHEADVLTDTVKVESTAKETKVIKIPMKVHKIAASASTEDNNGKEQRQTIGFKTQTIETQKPNESPTDNVSKTLNSFAESVTIKAPTDIVGQQKVKNCEYCGNAFTYTVSWKKYCCDAHRIAAFEQRSGKILNKKKAK